VIQLIVVVVDQHLELVVEVCIDAGVLFPA
jgi:hypothetical protein